MATADTWSVIWSERKALAADLEPLNDEEWAHHAYPLDALVSVADFYQGSNLIIGGKRRIAGLHLVATDTDWNHGSGPDVSGPVLSLVLAMTGRKAALSELTGDGVEILSGRP